MRNVFLAVRILLLVSVFASAQTVSTDHSHHAEPAFVSSLTQDWAKQELEKSPRHQEWVLMLESR